MKFGQAMYTVDENDQLVQVSLVLNNPSSTDKSIKVFATNESANGKYLHNNILANQHLLI